MPQMVESIIKKLVHDIFPDLSEESIGKCIDEYHKEIEHGNINPTFREVVDITLNDALNNRQITRIESKKRLIDILTKEIPEITENQTYTAEVIDSKIHVKIISRDMPSVLDFISTKFKMHHVQRARVHVAYDELMKMIAQVSKYCDVKYKSISR